MSGTKVTQNGPSLALRQISIAIDRGGTFTDVFAWTTKEEDDDDQYPLRSWMLKLPSDDNAPIEGIRRILAMATNQPLDTIKLMEDEDDGSSGLLGEVRLGTTVATNALLERRGGRTALITSRGQRDVLQIDTGTRPYLFALDCHRPPPLPCISIELHDERIAPLPRDPVLQQCRLQSFQNNDNNNDGDVVQVVDQGAIPIAILASPSRDSVRNSIQSLQEHNIDCIAIALTHSYAYDVHEALVMEEALAAGYKHVVASHRVLPMAQLVARASTTVVEAYLAPPVEDFISSLKRALGEGRSQRQLALMLSDGALVPPNAFSGARALLSGPAGGVIATRSVGRRAQERDDCHVKDDSFVWRLPERWRESSLLGFDMGGTSTDVSRVPGDGRLTYIFDGRIDGVGVSTPRLDVRTVAAGGGSCLDIDVGGMLRVGPRSAAALPGPAAYNRGGPATVTDANLILGRLLPQRFPQCFGAHGDAPLNPNASILKIDELLDKLHRMTSNASDERVHDMSREQLAAGFLRVANEAMARPIRALTQGRGHEAGDHLLVCFGGAAGQHVCALARLLGIEWALVPRCASILSAWGIALADRQHELIQAIGAAPLLDSDVQQRVINALTILTQRVFDSLLRQSGESRMSSHAKIQLQPYLHLRFAGTSSALPITGPIVDSPTTLHLQTLDVNTYIELFRREYADEFGFQLERDILVDDVRVRGTLSGPKLKSKPLIKRTGSLSLNACETTNTYFDKMGWIQTPVYDMKQLLADDIIDGPALIVEDSTTILIEPRVRAGVTRDGDLLLNIQSPAKTSLSSTTTNVIVNPVLLAVFAHRFSSIAEEMGRVLQRTAISTNIKDRLDFSCAIFGPNGGLLVQAPFIPVHIGAMAAAVQFQSKTMKWRRGDVLLSNHPRAGGSHLPDLTVIQPVFADNDDDLPLFFVANRGHHADIGGITPGSMPAFSKSIFEEGVSVMAFYLIEAGGGFREDAIRELFSKSRNLEDNVSDLKAQVAANHRGIALTRRLIAAHGLCKVQFYMEALQDHAETVVRSMLKQLVYEKAMQSNDASIQTLELRAQDYLDDGTPIQLLITVDARDGSAIFDFSGTGNQVYGNLNAPPAVTSSAILYCLRALVELKHNPPNGKSPTIDADEDAPNIPLNGGCLRPITILLPHGSVLNPSEDAAVVGGNVLTSQRVTDVILLAFKACAASQGCTNNLTLGSSQFGYYETIAGGAGAGPGWHGASAIQTHMTNTKATDIEILEQRYPILLREFSIRHGSGGNGQWMGGNGVVRELQVLDQPLDVTILSERRSRAPYGMNGGASGRCGRNTIIRARDGRRLYLGGKNTYKAVQGDRIIIETPGGGGYGVPNPIDKDVDDVE